MNRVCLKDQTPPYAFPIFFCISNKFLLSPLKFSFSDNFKWLFHHADLNETFLFDVHLLRILISTDHSPAQSSSANSVPDGYLWKRFWHIDLLKEQNNSHFCPKMATGGWGFYPIPSQSIHSLQISCEVPSSVTAFGILSGGALFLGWGFGSEVLTQNQQCPVVAAHLSLFLMRSLVLPAQPPCPCPALPWGEELLPSHLFFGSRGDRGVSVFAVCQWLPRQGCGKKILLFIVQHPGMTSRR